MMKICTCEAQHDVVALAAVVRYESEGLHWPGDAVLDDAIASNQVISQAIKEIYDRTLF